ncbi:hypothetical protein NE848_07815 [Gramella jeungdoensis]|uniref:Uncharacterized protein n=1 Tax=Gramella jeungdoensis TaxID=708091 RepID=A0ABT0Z0N5_9FLAO|nr:hypothetical protein [Gramella jeungdoensis]MCM8569281.1 hypothetical protein [Gramella jeungdoensis]
MSIQKLKIFRFFFVALMGLSLVAGCKSDKDKDEDKEMEETAKADKKSSANSGVFTITTRSMEFTIPSDTLPSGWNTIRYKNNSNEVHLILFDKYPEGKGIEDAHKEVIPPFQEGMDLINEGKMEEAQQAFGKLPEWFQEVEFTGGVGLLSPGTEAQSTIKLEPGTYIIECYVKMADGTFHSLQMTEQVQVTETDSGMEPPEADYVIDIDATNGIQFDKNISAGKKTFQVNYGEQKVHEHYLQHDVNIVWVDEGANMAKLEKWVNWSDPKGLQTPAPEGFRFLGGVQEMKAGDKGFFTVDLKPGKYALISEVPESQGKGMLQTFEVK